MGELQHPGEWQSLQVVPLPTSQIGRALFQQLFGAGVSVLSALVGRGRDPLVVQRLDQVFALPAFSCLSDLSIRQ